MSEQSQEGRTPRIGDVIGRYRILEVIGRGSTGPVFRAWDESLSREVALKTLWPQYVAEEDVRRRFEREARAAARLDSPFVVRVYDIGEEDGVPFIAMEFLRAGPVVSEKNATTMDWRRAAEIGRDVAAALAQAHAQGIIHRDIKPANVMLGADGRAKLADFGLARAVAEESIALTSAGFLLGTPAYLAPEVIEGNEASPLSDIYSLGVLLFRLVTGRLPFDASSAAGVLRGHLEGRFPRAASLIAGVPDGLDKVIGGCTARDPEARYPGAEFVAEDLERLLAGEPIAGPPKTTEAFRIEVPFWARFIPGAERTIMTVKTEVAAVERRAKDAARLLEETEALVRGLEEQASSAERNAAGWRSVAERAMEEGREEEAREALGYALQFDGQAESYRAELEKTRTAAREAREAAIAAWTGAEEAAVKGRMLLNRRDRARLFLGRAWRPGHRFYVAGGALLVSVLLVMAVSYAWPRNDKPVEPEADAAPAQPPTPVAPPAARRTMAPFIEAPAGSIPEDAWGVEMAVGDIDGDGDSDVLVSAWSSIRPYILWNDGNGRFRKEPRELFPGVEGSNVFFKIMLEDVDGDGAPDAFLLASRLGENIPQQSHLFLNDGRGYFTDATATHLPPKKLVAADAIFFDADGNGTIDLFIACGAAISNVYAQDQLFLNDGQGHFRDATASNLPSVDDMSFGVDVGDLNGDGFPDLALSRRFGTCKVLINDGTGRFRDEGTSRMPQTPINPSPFTSVLADMNGDGALDFLVGTSPRHYAGQGEEARLYLNDGQGVFRDATAERMPRILATAGNGVVSKGDLNRDGWPEVYMTNNTGPGTLFGAAADAVLDLTAQGVLPGHQNDAQGAGALFFDANGDGWLDVLVSRGKDLPLRLYLNPGGSTPSRTSQPLDLGALPIDRLPFSDDFNRPDGGIGNGWHSWWGRSVDHSNIRLSSGQLVTEGYTSNAGGVFRRLPVQFPISFSFDFQSAMPHNPGDPSNNAGWYISFNTPNSSLPWLCGGIGQQPSQVCFYQCGGTRHIIRTYWNAAGARITDLVPDKEPPIPGQRDYGMEHVARIHGRIQSDLSAEIIVTYNDGKSPASVTFRFPPPVDPAPGVSGEFLCLGNADAYGTHTLDNFSIRAGIE